MPRDKTYSIFQIDLNRWRIKVNYKTFSKIRTTIFEMNYGEMLQLTDILDWSGFENITK